MTVRQLINRLQKIQQKHKGPLLIAIDVNAGVVPMAMKNGWDVGLFSEMKVDAVQYEDNAFERATVVLK